jgi:hypothetical protein
MAPSMPRDLASLATQKRMATLMPIQRTGRPTKRPQHNSPAIVSGTFCDMGDYRFWARKHTARDKSQASETSSTREALKSHLPERMKQARWPAHHRDSCARGWQAAPRSKPPHGRRYSPADATRPENGRLERKPGANPGRARERRSCLLRLARHGRAGERAPRLTRRVWRSDQGRSSPFAHKSTRPGIRCPAGTAESREWACPPWGLGSAGRGDRITLGDAGCS